ncbi:TRAFAC clade GTPase domain-containing protein [Vibrio lentus]|uniref:TRAFAC clade GTPase domain-containing protein n=1 Tax=Vibrio splendidus TaxID=29497 RepID=UPI000C82A328|nr:MULTISPECIES: GTPase [Vibrio]PMH59970.1 hypothetical protein BCU64_20870 [Vibrio lentus]PTO78790.1 hypothetical protein CWN84_05950 [Vibrio splendidus]
MKCTNPNCNYEIDGSCLDGLSIDDCPSLADSLNLALISPEGIDSLDKDSTETNLSDKKIQLFGQSPLTESAASSTMKSFPSKVISFVGPVSVGKTTLISSMYDIFNRTNKLNIQFGRSLSIYAFEKLCHHARVTSNGNTVSTPRTTSADGVTFYNISIVDASKTRQEIYLADRSGESYSEMLNDTSLVKQFSELERSDLICILVDASSLGNKATRHICRRHTLNLIKTITSNIESPESIRVILLLTKFDLVEGTDAEELCNTEISSICRKVNQDCAIALDIIQLSARPFLEEQETPDSICELWDIIAKSERVQRQTKFITYRSERSFHNLELIYD